MKKKVMTLLLALVLPGPLGAAPPVSITLGPRHGHAGPTALGCVHLGGGNIDVQQPSPDTLIVTMTGVAVATGYPLRDSLAIMAAELHQEFEISFDDPKVKKAKLTMEGRVIGLLRCENKKAGSAQQGTACAAVAGPGTVPVSLCVPPHSVGCGEQLSINCREGPASVPIVPGRYLLHQNFLVQAAFPQCVVPCKPASAEFAPDPALDPLWISHKEPFHGAAKKDFGFQVIIRVAAE